MWPTLIYITVNHLFVHITQLYVTIINSNFKYVHFYNTWQQLLRAYCVPAQSPEAAQEQHEL